MFKNIFSFSGRIRRTEWWLTGPLVWVIMIPLSLLCVALPFLLFIIWIIPIWLYLASSVKRSHDLGNAGWLILIPIYNPLFLAFASSEPFKNKYGPNPKGIDISATHQNQPHIIINNNINPTSVNNDNP